MPDISLVPVYVIVSFIALFYLMGLSFFAALGVFVMGILANMVIGYFQSKVWS